jgi:GNAT superfamily N-acetyltransferase
MNTKLSSNDASKLLQIDQDRKSLFVPHTVLILKDNVSYLFSNKNSSISLNNAVSRSYSKNQYEDIQKQFVAHNKVPTISVASIENNNNELNANGYKLLAAYDNHWLFYKNEESLSSNVARVIERVDSKTSLEIFLETYDKCYIEKDPQNPFGTVSHFIPNVRNAWIKERQGDTLDYYIAFDQRKPVAVACLHSVQKVGFIFNIGSLPAVRGKGFGKAITLHAVQKSIDYGNQHHVLTTEKNSFAYDFYHRIGFQDLFTAHYFQKNPT